MTCFHQLDLTVIRHVEVATAVLGLLVMILVVGFIAVGLALGRLVTGRLEGVRLGLIDGVCVTMVDARLLVANDTFRRLNAVQVPLVLTLALDDVGVVYIDADVQSEAQYKSPTTHTFDRDTMVLPSLH